MKMLFRPCTQCITQRLVLNHPRGLSQDPDTPGLCDKPLGGEKDQLFCIECGYMKFVSIQCRQEWLRDAEVCAHNPEFNEVVCFCTHVLARLCVCFPSNYCTQSITDQLIYKRLVIGPWCPLVWWQASWGELDQLCVERKVLFVYIAGMSGCEMLACMHKYNLICIWISVHGGCQVFWRYLYLRLSAKWLVLYSPKDLSHDPDAPGGLCDKLIIGGNN
jgi:hypothetical protein